MSNIKNVEVKNLNKSFTGVRALVDFSFDLYKGEVHCLIGENGAGKSTFIKILSGAITPDSGIINIGKKKYNRLFPAITKNEGIEAVHQEGTLVPQITVAENIFLGSEKSEKMFVSYRRLFRDAAEFMESLNINIRPDEFYENLSLPDQQFVKILRALIFDPRVLILDEPTAVFNINDIKIVTKLVKKISKKGVSVIYISHHLEEIAEVADRVTVLRDGRKVKAHNFKEESIDLNLLANEMIGRPVELFYKKKKHKVGDVIFEVRGLKLNPKSKEINFKVREGEILGLAGLKGSGRTKIARAIFGVDKKYQGKIFYKGKEITPNSPGEALEEGLCMMTENKQIDGLCMNASVVKNITLAGLDRFKGPIINLKEEARLAKKFVDQLGIKTPTLNQEVINLSGGNKQKVVLAKWLFRGINILIVDEPTHGIDVNSKIEIYEILTDLVSKGKSIIMVSSEMPELIAMSDNVIVIKDYEISSVLSESRITEENILLGFMGGGSR